MEARASLDEAPEDGSYGSSTPHRRERTLPRIDARSPVNRSPSHSVRTISKGATMSPHRKPFLVLAVVVASCTGDHPAPLSPSAASTVSSSGGIVTSSAAGDVKSGAGSLDLDRLRLDRQSPVGVSVLRQYALPGQTYRMEVGETIELWAEYSGASNPRLIVDWGAGEPSSPDFTGCGSCLLNHRYANPGRYTVVVKLDDRVSTTVTRTFVLDSTPLVAANACVNLGWKFGSSPGWSCPAGFRFPTLSENALVASCLTPFDTGHFSYYHDIAVSAPGGCNCKWNGGWCGQPSIETFGGRTCGDYDQLLICVQ